MNSIRRILAESDQDCFAPVLASDSASLRRSRQLRRPTGPGRDKTVSKEKVVEELTELADSLSGSPLDKYSGHIRLIAESIDKGSFIPFDAEITASTTQVTDVVTSPRPPEKDPVIAAILGKEPPKIVRPPLEVVQAEKNKENGEFQDPGVKADTATPSPESIQRAMEDAIHGRESKPKMELVESSGMATAMGLLKMESFSGGPVGTIGGSSQPGSSAKVWSAFRRFVK